jgi:hypothetical protein
MKRFAVHKGDRYGKFVVLREVESRSGKRMVLCRCECGNFKSVRLGNLRSGNTSSCGCNRSIGRVTHGMSYEHEYRSWKSMKERCLNPTSSNYSNYGGRGIGICSRWLKFSNFIADMGKAPSECHSVDRIDNNGSYCSANCRWATSQEQARNRRNNLMISMDGVSKSLVEWIEDIGGNYQTIYSRLLRGMPPREAFLRGNN